MQAKSWAKRLAGVGSFLGGAISALISLSSFSGRGRVLTGEEDFQILITVLICVGVGGFLGRVIGRAIDNRKSKG